jgi:glutamate formiminotransferase
VGARGALVAYNLVLAHNDVAHARRVAAAVRSPALRTLGLAIGDEAQVSCNLLSPLELGPAEAYDLVSALVEVRRAELVGLIPASVLARTPSQRWSELDLGPERTLERRLAQAQADRARTAPFSSGRRTSPN